MHKVDLLELISSTLGCHISEINMQSGLLNHYLWESLAHIEIIMAIETDYHVVIPDDLIAKLDTVEKIFKCLLNLGVIDE